MTATQRENPRSDLFLPFMGTMVDICVPWYLFIGCAAFKQASAWDTSLRSAQLGDCALVLSISGINTVNDITTMGGLVTLTKVLWTIVVLSALKLLSESVAFCSLVAADSCAPNPAGVSSASLSTNLGHDGRLTKDTVNPKVVNAEYAVRGEVLLRAQELDREKKMKIVYCNIGNPQALGQKPITFVRRVLSVLMNPEDLNRKDLPSDVIERAKHYLKIIPYNAGVGAYTDSQGLLGVREEVADYLTRRDGHKGDASKIFLTSGASAGVELIARTLLRSSDDALIVPIPQYPLYSATTTLLDGHFEGYELKEAANWDTDLSSIEAALERVRKLKKNPRAIVVINPGNPVGSTLSEATVRNVVELCEREKLILLADEVYQENVYAPGKKFVSFRKALLDLRKERGWSESAVQLVSFHSISKGVSGECGLRGGYFEIEGFDADVKSQIYKLASISLCPNVPGQFAVGLMVNPPKPGSPSYQLDHAERIGIFESLTRRAQKMAGKLNTLEGVSCQPVEGAMYAFPQLTLPKRFVKEAARLEKHPDTLYSLRLLEATGVVVVPGNGFGQAEGTYHFRTTILPPEDVLDEVLEKFANFHRSFINEWRD